MANKKNLKWAENNSKLKKDGIIGFGIPAYKSKEGFKTCPKAGACAAVCYAQQGAYLWSPAKNAREFNLKIVRGKDFAKLAIEDLHRIRKDKVRVHDSGDFFNQTYLNAWFEIARAHPQKLFYAYTKSIHLDFSKQPKNFKITQSEGGTMDKHINRRKSHSRIFSTVEAREKAGYVDGNKNDFPAIEGKRKIGLVYHGTKKMTDKQIKHFS